MAWYLFSNKPVSKPMMTYHLFNPQISFQRNCLKMQMSHSRRCTWTYRPLFLCHLGPRAYEFKGCSGKNEKLIWSIDDINSLCETCIVSQDLKPENNNMDMINITWYVAWSSSGCIYSARQQIPGENFKTKEFWDYFRLQCAAAPAKLLWSSVPLVNRFLLSDIF